MNGKVDEFDSLPEGVLQGVPLNLSNDEFNSLQEGVLQGVAASNG